MTSIKLTDYQCQALKVPVGSTVEVCETMTEGLVSALIELPPKPKTSRERFEAWFSTIYVDPYSLPTSVLAWASWLEAERQAKELPREH